MMSLFVFCFFFFFFQAEDGIRDYKVTGVQTCALPISVAHPRRGRAKLSPHDPRSDLLCDERSRTGGTEGQGRRGADDLSTRRRPAPRARAAAVVTGCP